MSRWQLVSGQTFETKGGPVPPKWDGEPPRCSCGRLLRPWCWTDWSDGIAQGMVLVCHGPDSISKPAACPDGYFIARRIQ